MRIVVDAAHGAGYQVAPAVFHELGAEVISLGVDPNGFNINDQVGATSPDALRRQVIESGADLGIALDGDGDRLIMVDDRGELHDGDRILYVIACDRARHQSVAGVVGTLMTNLGLEHALAQHGITCVRAKVGDRYVLETLLDRGWTLGGENSGHVICLDRHTTGDGIVAALQVLAALRRQDRGLAEVGASLELYPQRLINVALRSGFNWATHSSVCSAVANAEARLAANGRVLLRASGTEPLLRVMVEGRDCALVDELADSIADAVRVAMTETRA